MTEKGSTADGWSGGLDEASRFVGQLVGGRYRVERLLARGGMAVVFLADDLQLHRRVALKVLFPTTGADTSTFEHRFRLEAQALAALSHPNIVTLYDFGETEDRHCYLAMEYVDGPRFTDLLKDGPLPPLRAVMLVLQVCQALRYAHKRGVFHRDLKPSNLLIHMNDDGTELVKVVDFGLVKLSETDQSLTQPGLVLGSPHCMAPEQVHGTATDNRTDIYAVGVLLFRAITGQFPFHGDNSTATMLAHLHRPVPHFFEVAPDIQVPEGLEAVVRRCLAKAPAERYPDMQQLAEALMACTGNSGMHLSTVSMMRPTPPMVGEPPVKRSLLPVGLALTGLGLMSFAMVVGLGWWLWFSEVGKTVKEVEKAAEVPVEPVKSVEPAVPAVPPPGSTDGTVQAAGTTENSPATNEKIEQTAEGGGRKLERAERRAQVPKGVAKISSSSKGNSVTTKPPDAKKTNEPPPEKPPEGYMPLPDDFK